ncbi:hypothetical protein EVAR_21688_1 [Eumeta japonica]|uniref:Uncharacterized protein n=1 Tax=Eumeta variegata TaxID=151549 RepID=A0A4C1W688_EUMVA|nr:hypothetical protein EVAR_21688_1 [Eumeta japonica]
MSSVQYSNARGREKERYIKVESKREKENDSVDPKHIRVVIQTFRILRNEEIEFVNATMFIRVALDDRLQWGPYYSEERKKLRSAAQAFKRIQNLSDFKIHKLVHYGPRPGF